MGTDAVADEQTFTRIIRVELDTFARTRVNRSPTFVALLSQIPNHRTSRDVS